jgi:hypothetical protein
MERRRGEIAITDIKRYLLKVYRQTNKRHEPCHTFCTLGAFLIAAGNGPEKQELLRLIGTLV